MSLEELMKRYESEMPIDEDIHHPLVREVEGWTSRAPGLGAQSQPVKRAMPPVGAKISFNGHEFVVLQTARTRMVVGNPDGTPIADMHVNAPWTLIGVNGNEAAVQSYLAAKRSVPVGTLIVFKGRQYRVLAKTQRKI
ncbi:MAG: hypothetical protein V2A73_16250, partial [Pseudomonadota bacterium]